MPLTENTPRPLVVDDEPLVLEVVERFARQLGFQVAFRSGGREALACFPGVKPDVALGDRFGDAVQAQAMAAGLRLSAARHHRRPSKRRGATAVCGLPHMGCRGTRDPHTRTPHSGKLP